VRKPQSAGRKAQARLLYLKKHGIEGREVAHAGYEIKQIFVVLALGVKPGLRKQLI
jgi:hypothetical protein